MNKPPYAPSRRSHRLRAAASQLAIASLCLTFAAGASAATTAPAAKGPPAKASPAKAARGKGVDYKSWRGYLGPESSQYSAYDQINKSDVSKLGVAWTYSTGTTPQRFNPLFVDGVLYLRGEKNALVALDAATGKELWSKPAEGRAGSRGMNYWQSADGKDRRLLFIENGALHAVNADNGEPITSFGDNGAVDLRVGLAGDITKIRPLQTDNPGQVYKNLIIISLPAGAYDFASPPADIHAYDTRTGKLVWVFHTVPQKGEFGYDTWPAKDHEKFGGVHNWSESTIDPVAGVIYIPTGTGRYDFYGGNRKGNDLFANSILALDASTGKRLWHFQAVHHDLWDYDFPVAPKLLTIHKDGKDIPIVAQASKQGFLYVLDRRNGKPIWPIKERPVPKSDVPGEMASPTQPFPTLPKPFARQGKFTPDLIDPYISDADKAKVLDEIKTCRNEGIFTPPSLTCTIEIPGHNGGAEWGLVAIDPVRHYLFVAARNLPTYDKLSLDTKEPIENMPNGGGDVQPYKAPVDFMLQSNSLSAMGPPWSTITAYNMDTGQIMWQVPDGEVTPLADKGIKDTGSHVPRGGTLVTGGLVFNGTSSDRKIRARDEKTGKVVWEYDIPAAQEGVPTVYEQGGREYIVFPVGGNGEFSNNLGLPKPAPGSNEYIAFALASAALAAAPMANAALPGPVKTHDGLVRGAPSATKSVTVFKGIPFAKPPVGDLRWHAPMPVTAWKGVFKATKFGNVCLQPHGKGRPNITVDEPDSPAMSEDCLYLNVWTGAHKPGEKRPVMVWIYGGAYTEGGGSTIAYDGTNLATKGAVVVTFNYRLGTLGFLSHPELTAESGHNASGNYALMDSIAVLRWIRANIAQFGGDPNNVTIMGQSAGACMVAALVGSPEAKGLFERGVSESGAWSGLSVAKMETLDQAEKATVAAADKLGIHSLKEMRAMSGEDALTKLGRANMIVDGWIIPEDLTKTFAEGHQNKVDVLVGNNGNEGGFGGGFGGRGPVITAATWKAGAEQRWGSAAALGLAAYPGATDEEAKADAGKPFTDNMAFLMRLFGASQERVGKRAWLYQFTHDPPYPEGKPNNGPTHATEVAYVFDNLAKPHLFPDGASPELAAKSPADRALADQMSSYWVNFARTGNPNGPGLPKWPELNELPVGEAMLLDDPSHPGVALTPAKFALYQAIYDRDFGTH